MKRQESLPFGASHRAKHEGREYVKAKHKTAEKITVSCPGCGRTQTVRKSKVLPCNYYTCSIDCKANPDWKHPATPRGFIHVYHICAAGAFTGHEFRPATEEEQESINRAKLIAMAGLRQLLEQNYQN